jgi:hypothetical protein
MRAAAPPAAAARCFGAAPRRTRAAAPAATLPPPARACRRHAAAAGSRCSGAHAAAAGAAAAAFAARAALPAALLRPPRRRRAAPRCAPPPPAAALDSLRSLAAAWDALQKLILTATAAGFLVAAATATTARGRTALRRGWAEFQACPHAPTHTRTETPSLPAHNHPNPSFSSHAHSRIHASQNKNHPSHAPQTSPEGAQAASLVHYLLLLLVAKLLELLTGMRGLLTFVYMGIFATQALHWVRTGLPGPEEARARVQALEAGLPYVPAPAEEAAAAFRAAFPELAGACTRAVQCERSRLRLRLHGVVLSCCGC